MISSRLLIWYVYAVVFTLPEMLEEGDLRDDLKATSRLSKQMLEQGQTISSEEFFHTVLVLGSLPDSIDY